MAVAQYLPEAGIWHTFPQQADRATDARPAQQSPVADERLQSALIVGSLAFGRGPEPWAARQAFSNAATD